MKRMSKKQPKKSCSMIKNRTDAEDLQKGVMWCFYITDSKIKGNNRTAVGIWYAWIDSFIFSVSYNIFHQKFSIHFFSIFSFLSLNFFFTQFPFHVRFYDHLPLKMLMRQNPKDNMHFVCICFV